MTIRVGSTRPAGSALTFNNALTLSGSNVQWGGPLVATTTITNSGFDIIFAQASSRSTRINSAGSFQIFNGSAIAAFETLPTGFLGSFSIKISPAGTAITANAYIHAKGVGIGSNNIIQLDNNGNVELFSVTENGIVRTGFRVDFIVAFGSTNQINFNRRIDFDLMNAPNQGSIYNLKQSQAYSTTGSAFSFMITSGSWAPASAGDTASFIHVTNTVNQTGTSSGPVIGFHFDPVLTAVRGRLIAFKGEAGDLVMVGSALTGSLNNSLVQLTQSWNTSGVVSLINADVTYTSSGAGSMFINLKKSGTSVFTVDPDGKTVVNSIQTNALSSGAGVVRFGKITGGVSWEIEVDGVTKTVTVT